MGINAIVIDDNKELCYTCFVELLHFSKINVIDIGKNGKEAAELYQKHRPDIVFMDVHMPEYDGFYGLKKIKEYGPMR